MNQIEDNASKEVSKIVIGTKADLDAEREVTTEEGVALAQKHGLQYV